jgi:hypothetical protein
MVLWAWTASVTVRAAEDTAWDDCKAAEPDRVIAGCTEVLRRGFGEPLANRAVAFYSRP